ncbi:uncharacterized protein [Gossypium hirsutum]|uniref:CCHC-type domain-containing protein n=1 Tax=Gossypium hirsutum TaxID=3635 RepID=A0A1U8MW75_GOSHI|nr:uncharacterized protein LOC107941952 [Gossypium hirsutum]
MERNVEERQPVRNVPDLNMQALLREVERLFDQKLEPIQDRLDQVEGRGRRARTPISPPRDCDRRHVRDDEVSEPSEAESEAGSNVSSRRRGQRHHGQRERERFDDDLKSIRLSIPLFQGRSDPEAYLEWEKKIKLIFECHNYLEVKKVKLAAIEFTDYAMIWWDQITTTRRRNDERPINTWAEMKAVMRRKFIPTHYHRELYQNLSQGTRSVEDYYKEMEVAMIRANVDEDREATMARFLSGLNREIANVVELQHYVEIVDMVHMAIKIEKQLKKKGAARGYSTTNVSRWNQGTSKNATESQTKDPKAPIKATKPTGENSKGKAVEGTQNRTRDIKCFKCLGRGHIASQCPNRSVMVIQRNGDIESEEEENEKVENNNETLFDAEEEIEYAVEGEMLVCSVVIDGGSCTNVASTLLVERLDLPTSVHPSPYKLQWLNDGIELKVTKQVLVPFSIGKYEDEVLCDVVPMHAGHILLGRPWQFDRRVKHDGFANQYTFKYQGRNFTLAPLTLKQVDSSPMMRLRYIPEERRFVMIGKGKVNSCFCEQGKVSGISITFLPNLIDEENINDEDITVLVDGHKTFDKHKVDKFDEFLLSKLRSLRAQKHEINFSFPLFAYDGRIQLYNVGGAKNNSLKTPCTILQSDLSSSSAPPCAIQFPSAHLSSF